MHFWDSLVLPLLVMYLVAVFFAIFMRWLCKLFGSAPSTVAVTEQGIANVVGGMATIAIWWTIAYVVFEVLL